MFGNRADRPFGVALRADVEAPVETRAEVLPSDARRELDELQNLEPASREAFLKGSYAFPG